nr:MAG TPA: Protein of unknown function (DUF616) [Caudoviricetes sp.]
MRKPAELRAKALFHCGFAHFARIKYDWHCKYTLIFGDYDKI